MCGAISSWELPVGVVTRVLTLLPARSIALCSCVARSWRSGAQHRECAAKVALAKPLELSRAANLACLEELLVSGPIPESRDFLGCTPLLHAATHGHKDLIDALLAVGADVHSQDIGGEEALLKASRWGHCSIINALLQAGAKVDAQNASGLTPLLAATSSGQLEAMKILLGKGASINASTCVDLLDHQDHFIPCGSTALHIAARECWIGAVEILIEHGASKTICDSEGRTAHGVVRYHKHRRLLQDLLR